MNRSTFLILILLNFLTQCGEHYSDDVSSSKAVLDNTLDESQTVNVDVNFDNSNSLDLAGTLDLSNMNLKVTGCASGYSQTFSSISSVKLYRNDKNCVAKLVSFVSNSETYQVLSGGTIDPTGDAFDPVETHITTFQSTTNSAHKLYAQVVTQLPSPISTSVSISMTLFALNSGTSVLQSIPNNVLRITAAQSSVDMNQASQIVSFTVHRVTQPSSVPLIVNYSIAGNAVAGTDYTNPSGTITLASTDTTKNINITLAAGNTAPAVTKTLEFNFENGNYFSYATGGLITLTNSYSSAPISNLIFHYDGTSITSSGGAVTAWADISGSGINAVQSTSSKRPTLGSPSSVVFDGANDFLTVPNNTSINSSESAYTQKVITMAFKTGSDVSRLQFLFAQGNSTYGLNIFVQSANLYVNSWNRAGTTWGPIYQSTAISADTFYVVSLVFDATAGTISEYLSGTLIGSVSGVGNLTSSGVNGIGGSTGSTRLLGTNNSNAVISNLSSSTCQNSQPCVFGGQIYDIAYYNGSLTSSQITTHHTYLMNKFQNTVSITKPGLSAITELSGTVPKAFKVLLGAPSSADLLVNYTVDSSSTAVAGTDYVALSGSVTIPAGYTSAYIPLTTIDNSGSSTDRTLRLNLSSSSSYSVSNTAANATITIADTDNYTPPNLLAWFNMPQSLTLNNINLVTNWNDIASNGTCTHPISAYQNTTGYIPTFQASTMSTLFDSTSMLNINSNACIDNISGGIAQRSIAIVFQTGSDVSTDQILYEQGSSTTGLSVAISNGNITLTAYTNSWNKNISKTIAANTLYAVIVEFKNNAALRIVLSSGLGTGSVTWSGASSTAGGSSDSEGGANLTAVSNNGIGIGGIRNGGKFYSSNTNALVSVSNFISNVNLLQNVQVFELIFMNNSIYSTGGTPLINLESYLATKYVH